VKLLGLPGRKSSTFQHMLDLTSRLRLGQDEAVVQAYGFWGPKDDPNPDPAPEARIAAESRADLVIAKSFGTLVTMVAGRDLGFAPPACVFLGTPLRRSPDMAALLVAHLSAVPTLLIQQTSDFNGSFAEVAAVAARAPSAMALEIPGDDHLYEDLDAIAPLIEAWWANRSPGGGGQAE
jgi:hypothetical protein